ARFGTNIKTWRLFADGVNDLGITLELLAPLYPRRFLAIICLASVFKAMCGVAAGATNAAITEHWALRNNIADIGAKTGAQHTVVTLAGLLLGIWFARFANASAGGVWASYSVLTALHLFANYRAMRTLALRSLNPARLSMLSGAFIRALAARDARDDFPPGSALAGAETGVGSGADSSGSGDGANDSGVQSGAEGALSLQLVAAREPLLWLPGWAARLWPWGDALQQVKMGVALSEMCEEADDLLWLAGLYHTHRAAVGVRLVGFQALGPRLDTAVAVALREDATSEDQAGLARAFFQACLVHHCLAESPSDIPDDPLHRKLFLRAVVEGSLRVTEEEFPAFWRRLAASGWDLGRVTLGPPRWLCRWGNAA
ncbi:unnamed protein product, partial [Phaeothamnion confervicola]